MTKGEIFENSDNIKAILQTHKVQKAYFFGSICTDKFTTQSDVDFLIDFGIGLDPIEYGELYFSLLYTLQDYIKREVDLVTEPSLKNPYFIKSINATKKVIYEQ